MQRSHNQILAKAHGLGIENNSYHWSKEDEELLYNAYLNNDRNYCYTLFPNRTHCSINCKLASFHIIKWSKWSEEELRILKENYSIKSLKEIQELIPNHSIATISVKATELGYNRRQRWTEQEIEILKEFYPKDGQEIYKRFPNRNKRNVLYKCFELKLKKEGHFWEEYENEILKKYWFTEGSECYKRLKNRNKQSCQAQATKLGLKTNRYRKELGNRYKKVLCIETNEIFVSIAEANRKYQGAGNMSKQILGEREYAGKLPDGTKLHWRYIEEGDEE